jgi:UPF0755 protein
MRKLLMTVIILFGLGGALFAWQTISFLNTPASSGHNEVIFEIPNGMAFHFIARDLAARGLVKSAFKLGLLAKISGEATRVKVGEYLLYSDMKPSDILSVITSGKSISYALVVPEGQNIYDIRDSLNKLWTGRGDEFVRVVTNPAIVQKWTGLKLNSLEGFLYPETYSVTKYTTPEMLARRMYEKFEESIKIANQNAKIQMSLSDQVILASIIEKETGRPEDRPMISSVFRNRLMKKIRLQSDPTILYGMLIENHGVMPKNIRKADILHPTPYNTYTIPALPIGPIANPGIEALRAAVNPMESNYLFFVSRNDGTSYFAETLEQHNKAVTKFQLDVKAREGKSWRDLKKHPAAQAQGSTKQ